MLLPVAIFVGIELGFASTNTLDLLREACPYTNFCTINSTNTSLSNDEYIPCCYDCFCDDNCGLFGDCCPDAGPNITQLNHTKLECRAVGLKLASFNWQFFKLPRYRYIDFCPDGYNNNTNVYVNCKGGPENERQIDDLVLVSDQHGRIFKNKHCADCHGAKNITSWGLAVQGCVDEIDTLQLSITNAYQYLLENCTLAPVRPSNVPVTARTMECSDDLPTCSIKDDRMRDGCLNGPHMPYIEFYAGGRMHKIHKNVLCFKCSHLTQESSLCPITEAQFKLGDTSYRMLLKTDVQSPTPNLGSCDASKTNDPHTGTCKRVYCPPFQVVSDGKCIPLSHDISDFLLAVNIVYTLPDTSGNLILDKIKRYDESVVQYYIRRINSRYSYPNCNIRKTVLALQTEKSTNKFVRLLLEVIYSVTAKCSLQFIGKQIRTNINDRQTWLLNDKTFEMIGQLTFYQDPPLNGDSLYHENVLIMESSLPVRIDTVTSFFICPYFKLSLREYLNHVKSLGKLDIEHSLNYFAPDSRCLEGFYPLKENEVAACVHNYHVRNNGPRKSAGSTVLLFGFLITCLFVKA